MNRIKLLLSFIVVLIFIISCNQDNSKDIEGTISSIDSINPTSTKAILTLRDSLHDDLARYLAGLPQNHKTKYRELESEKNWINYSTKMNNNWEKLKVQRLNPIFKWDTSYFSKQVVDSLPLIYPFSGPDLLHAVSLFPRSKTYVLLALEQLHDLPKLEKLNRDSRTLFFNSLENSLKDVMSKSYFITTHMGSDLHSEKVKGVLPLLYFFTVRSGMEIRDVDQMVLDTSGKAITSDWQKTGKKIRVIKIIARDPKTETEKTIYYVSCNLSNTGMNFTPELSKFLKSFGTCNTFIKAASYMPHYSTFKSIRDLLIEQSALIFQDDTGFPYKYFKNKKKYEVQLFGEYAQPVKDFGDYVFQKDLDSVYHSKDSVKIKPLGFHLGYHWGDKKQAILLIKKK